MTVDAGLLKWASQRQAEIIQAVIQHNGQRGASRVLGVSRGSIQDAINRVKVKAALHGYAPDQGMTQEVPSPFVVKGTSTLYDENGAMRLQWVKTKLDDEAAEAIVRQFIADLTQDVKGKGPKVKAPKKVDSDLLAVYPMGDPHFGMYAWAAEAGDDFNTELAESLTCAAIDRLVDSAPAADTGIILVLGDLIHADSTTNRTPNSGATLDVDTRWARVMQIGLRALRYSITKALAKHKKVIVRIVRGNHDPHASIAISLALEAFFHGNERVTVDLSPSAHWYYQHGEVLIGSTHGDTTKKADLLGVMASDKPQEWGQTKHRYWYCGHVHHVEQKEFPGVVVEYFRTLAPKDAWHAAQGYRSGRDMCLIVLHKKYGEIERHRCDVAML